MRRKKQCFTMEVPFLRSDFLLFYLSFCLFGFFSHSFCRIFLLV